MFNKRIVLLTLSLVLLASSAAADVLVTVKGVRIETAGPWEVKRNLVVFTTPAGVLSSVRLSEIDLEASEQATNAPPAEAAEEEAAEEEDAPPPEPRFVLTNDDIPPAEVVTAGRPTESEEGEDGEDGEDGEEEETDGEESAAAEDPCTPDLKLNRPRVSRRRIVVDGTALPRTGCPRIVRVHWDWGDGTRANGSFPGRHTYAAPGQYQVVVEAFDARGHKTRQQATVDIQ